MPRESLVDTQDQEVGYDPNAIAQTIQLTKRYGSNRGIEEVNLKLLPGQSQGFLGPNGAGKTTTIRCMLNLLRPTSGEVYLFGQPVSNSTAYLRDRVGYIAGEVGLLLNYTGEDHIKLVEGLKRKKAPHAYDLAKRFELDLKRKVRTLSKGNKQKLALVLAFMHDNSLFILDEPTSGLDPLYQQVVFQLINERKAQGASVLLSSHILSEVEQVCESVSAISMGRLLVQESISSLLSRQQRHITVRFATDVDYASWPLIKGMDNIRWETPRFFQASIHPAAINDFIQALSKYPIADLSVQHVSLEEVFMSFYGANQFASTKSTTPSAPSQVQGDHHE